MTRDYADAVRSYLEQCFQIGTAPRVDELAQRLRVHPSVLSRKFRLATGRSLSSVLKDSQIAEAKRLLRSTELPLREVALRAGFGTPNTLFRVFRTRVGVTPAEYRSAPNA
jgi:AraC-like DNA-binding protein